MIKRMLALLVVTCLTLTIDASAAETVKVVYQINLGTEQASRALNNIRNHLAADPQAKIVVVAFSAGIDFLLDGALDPHGQPFSGRIGDLANRGVEFRACDNTLKARGIPREKLALEAQVVPSGVAEIARLQAIDGFAYIVP